MLRKIDRRTEGGQRASLQRDTTAGAWHNCFLGSPLFEIDLLMGHEPWREE